MWGRAATFGCVLVALVFVPAGSLCAQDAGAIPEQEGSDASAEAREDEQPDAEQRDAGRAGAGADDALGAEQADVEEPELVDEEGGEADDEPASTPRHSEGEDELAITYLLERVDVRGQGRTDPAVVRRYVPFRPGEPIDTSDDRLAEIRFRLLGTGFFDEVELSLERGSARGRVVLVVRVSERNTFVVEQLAFGVSEGLNDPRSSEASVYFGGSVAETNFLGTGATLFGSFLLSPPQQGLRLGYFDPSLLGSGAALSAGGFFYSGREGFGNGRVLVAPPLPRDRDRLFGPEDASFAIVRYHRGGGWLGTGFLLDPTVRFDARYSLEVVDVLSRPDAASELRGTEVRPIDFHIADSTSLVTMVTLELFHDARDDPSLTRSGRVLSLRGDLGTRILGGNYDLVRVQLLFREWLALPEWDHTLRLSGFVGAAFGDTPFFYRFYAADLSDLYPARILEMSVDRRPAPNLLGTAIGAFRLGELAARVDVEYSLLFWRPGPEVRSVWGYANVGVYMLADRELFARPVSGYVVSVPIDLTFDVGVRIDTSIGVFQVGVSTLFGFVSL